MEIEESKFISGFNSGYLLAKFEPQLLAKVMSNIRPVNSFIQGMVLGQKEFELNYAERDIEELRKIRLKGRDQRSLEKD